MVRLRNRFNGGIVNVDEDFAAQLDPTMWEPAEKETPSEKPAPRRGRKKADDASGDSGA